MHSTTAFRPLLLRKTLKYCPGLVDHYKAQLLEPEEVELILEDEDSL
jgi:hypothetical protein